MKEAIREIAAQFGNEFSLLANSKIKLNQTKTRTREAARLITSLSRSLPHHFFCYAKLMHTFPLVFVVFHVVAARNCIWSDITDIRVLHCCCYQIEQSTIAAIPLVTASAVVTMNTSQSQRNFDKRINMCSYVRSSVKFAHYDSWSSFYATHAHIPL